MLVVFIANRLADLKVITPPLVFTLTVMAAVAKAVIHFAG